MIKKIEVAPGILVYDDVIQDFKTLAKDIEEGMEAARLGWKDAFVKDYSGVVINKKIRDVEQISIEKIQPGLANPIKESFYNTLFGIFEDNFSVIENDYRLFYNVETNWHDTYQVLKYGKDQHFAAHSDHGFSYVCTVSTVMYLNDNYSGGGLHFPFLDYTYTPEEGDIVLFPSTFLYMHAALPVEEGIKYAAVTMFDWNNRFHGANSTIKNQ
jgi:hypothetical protein